METTTLDLNIESGSLEELIGHFEAFDIEMPQMEQWRELKAGLRETRAPAIPFNLLDRTTEELDEWARAVALDRTIKAKPDYYGDELARLSKPLDNALRTAIKANAASIVDQLRPQFNAAADVFRATVVLGVAPDADMQSLFRASEEQKDAWVAAQEAAPIIDGIFTTRQMLSTVAGVSPTFTRHMTNMAINVDFRNRHITSGIDWNSTVIRPGSTATLATYNPEAPWERWIAVAPELQLTAPPA